MTESNGGSATSAPHKPDWSGERDDAASAPVGNGGILERHLRDRARARHAGPRGPTPARDPAPGDFDAPSSPGIPLPKALTDFLVHTAFLGIDTTAKLSKPILGPGLELTQHTLLPQIILPLFREIAEEYLPVRVQNWMKVVPTSLKHTRT